MSDAKKPLHKNPFFWAAVLGVLFLTAVRPLLRRVPELPPSLGQVGTFALTDEAGRSFTHTDVAGKVWIANFFFTSCKTVCPPMMKQMAALRSRFDAASIPVEFVSVTVDPETDTSAVLQAYADKAQIPTAQWHFLTGPASAVGPLVREGFKSYLGEKEVTPDGLMDIGHAARVMLVDQNGHVRGAYQISEAGMDEAFHRAQHVLQAAD